MANRSEMMRAVCQRDTSPGRTVRGLLRAHGAHSHGTIPASRGGPTSPIASEGGPSSSRAASGTDTGTARRRRAGGSDRVLVTNAGFWSAKIEDNHERDERKVRQFRALDLQVLTVW